MSTQTAFQEQVNPYFLPGLNFKKTLQPKVTVERIISLCAEVYGAKTTDLAKKSRKRENVDTRSLSMLLMVFLLDKTLSYSAMRFNRDHATASHGLKNMQKLFQTDSATRKKVKQSLESLGASEKVVRLINEFLLSDLTITQFRKII